MNIRIGTVVVAASAALVAGSLAIVPAGAGPALAHHPAAVAAKATPSVALSYTKNPIRVGKHGHAYVYVSGTGVMPTGKVRIKQGATLLAKGTLNIYGSATIKLPKLAKGKHKLRAYYLGDATYAKARSAKVALIVRKHLSAPPTGGVAIGVA